MDSDAEVIEFPNRFITADSSLVSPEAIELQGHLHTQHRNGRRTVGAFGFPQPPLSESEIGCPLEEDTVAADEVQAAMQDWRANRNMLRSCNPLCKRARRAGAVCPENNLTLPQLCGAMDADRYRLALRSSVIRTTVSLRRSVKDRMINRFNGNLLKLWQANVDVQFILNPYAAAMYVALFLHENAKRHDQHESAIMLVSILCTHLRIVDKSVAEPAHQVSCVGDCQPRACPSCWSCLFAFL